MLLVSLDLVERDGDGFRNSDDGRALLLAIGREARARCRGSNPFYAMTGHLTEALREYSPRWRQTLGVDAADAFAALYANPAGVARLRGPDERDQRAAGPADCRAIRLCAPSLHHGRGRRTGRPVDRDRRHAYRISAGSSPTWNPSVSSRGRTSPPAGLTDRFTAVAADLIAGPYPAGADVILLGHILHDWSDEVCGTILRNCAAALPAGGTLLISESVLHDDFSGSTLTHMKDLLMLVANESGARERSESEYRELLDAAGFDVTDVTRLDAPQRSSGGAKAMAAFPLAGPARAVPMKHGYHGERSGVDGPGLRCVRVHRLRGDGVGVQPAYRPRRPAPSRHSRKPRSLSGHGCPRRHRRRRQSSHRPRRPRRR